MKTALIGIVLAIAAVLGGQLLEGGQVSSLFQSTAMLIVLGGTFGAVLIQTPYSILKQSVRMIRGMLAGVGSEGIDTIERLASLSLVARREGILALERHLPEDEDAFVLAGLQMLVDGYSPVDLRSALEVKLATLEEELREGARVFETAGGYAPTIGILGAVLGLIHIMESLGDPSRLGAGIAVAFVSTIYGVGLANLILLPLAGRLRTFARRRVIELEMFLDGLVGIAAGENPRVITARLRGYLVA